MPETNLKAISAASQIIQNSCFKETNELQENTENIQFSITETTEIEVIFKNHTDYLELKRLVGNTESQ